MRIYGYARISRPTQNVDRQIRNIKEYAQEAVIYKEAYTGTTQQREQWQKLLKRVECGDMIIFDSVSRMSRDAAEGFRIYEELFRSGVELVFLKEPHISTATYRNALAQQISETGNEIADVYIEATNRVLMILARQQIKIAFEQAEKEVVDLHIRTAEGMKTAKMAGKQIGRQAGSRIVTKKAKKVKNLISRHSIDFGGTLTDVEIMKMAGDISRNSYYKYKRELRAE